jgi:putative ABC transport system permease protein
LESGRYSARETRTFSGKTLVEAIVVTAIALPIALVLVELLLQDMTGLLGIAIAGKYYHTWEYLLGFVLLTTAVGLVAGGYVSVYLSAFNPIDILKSKIAAGSRKLILRRALITSQMIIFLGLTLMSLTVYRQLRLFQERDLGFERENLVIFYPEVDDFGKSLDAFKNEVGKHPEIAALSGAFCLPMTEAQGVIRVPRKEHPDEKVTLEGMTGDRDIIETLGLKMVAGTSFRDHTPGIEARYCILNETAVRELGLTEPVGEQIGGSTVIGVVKDFNMHSFRSKIGPLSIRNGTRYVQEIAARITPGNLQETAKWIAAQGAQFNGGKPLEFETFESRVGDLYGREQRFAKAIGYSTGLAIFVSCLGIFGMSIFVSQQKIKEIGIRKVLGASTANVYTKLTKEFVGLILVSSLVAFPIASYLVKGWLEQFIYRVDIGAPEIALTILVDTAIVLGTVSYQALRAATVNPIESLRYE